MSSGSDKRALRRINRAMNAPREVFVCNSTADRPQDGQR